MHHKKHCFHQLKICYLTLYYKIQLLKTPRKWPFETFDGKRAAFSPFSDVFSTHQKANFNFLFTFTLSSTNALNLDQSKILSFALGLIGFPTIFQVYHFGQYTYTYILNSLPNKKILDWSKFKTFADNKINVAENLKFVLERVENTVGKGDNAGYHHFLLFLQCFQKPSLSGSLKVWIVWLRVKVYFYDYSAQYSFQATGCFQT